MSMSYNFAKHNLKEKKQNNDMNIGSCHLKESCGPSLSFLFQLQKINATSVKFLSEYTKNEKGTSVDQTRKV
jgi:hypothetical protein